MGKLSDYFKQQAEQSGLSEEDIQSVEAFFKDEKLESALADTIVTKEEHEKILSERESTIQGLNDDIAANKRWYDEEALPAVEAAKTAQARHEAELNAYKKLLGELPPDSNTANPAPGSNGQYMTRAEAEEMIRQITAQQGNQISSGAVDLIAQMQQVVNKHNSMFKDELPVVEFKSYAEDFVSKNGQRPLVEIYDRFNADKIQEHTQKAEQQRIDAEVQKRVQAEISKRGLPDSPQPQNLPIDLGPPPSQRESTSDPSEEQQRSEWMEAWNSSADEGKGLLE